VAAAQASRRREVQIFLGRKDVAEKNLSERRAKARAAPSCGSMISLGVGEPFC